MPVSFWKQAWNRQTAISESCTLCGSSKTRKIPCSSKQNNKTSTCLSVYVYINVMMKTACATFSLQDNMPFPLPTESNTRNEAAAPEHKQKKNSKAWGNNWVKPSEVPKDCFSRETHVEYGDTWRNWLKTKLVPVFSISPESCREQTSFWWQK